MSCEENNSFKCGFLKLQVFFWLLFNRKSNKFCLGAQKLKLKYKQVETNKQNFMKTYQLQTLSDKKADILHRKLDRQKKQLRIKKLRNFYRDYKIILGLK